jgi:hypothetical protein
MLAEEYVLPCHAMRHAACCPLLRAACHGLHVQGARLTPLRSSVLHGAEDAHALCCTASALRQVLEARAGDNWIVKDLMNDAFYRFLLKASRAWRGRGPLFACCCFAGKNPAMWKSSGGAAMRSAWINCKVNRRVSAE